MSYLKTTAIQHLNGSSPNIYLDANTNVGIGTSSPGYKLDVSASSFVAASVSTSFSGAGNIRIADSTTTSASAPYIGSVGNNLAFGRIGTAEYMRIDSNGYVTKPYTPIFSGVRSGYGWESYPSASVWIANLSLVNNGNCYNTSNGLFTCPVTGYYKISAGILIGKADSATAYGYMMYAKNGAYSTFLNHLNGSSGSVWATISYNITVSASVNDTLAVGLVTVNGNAAYGDSHGYVNIELVT